MQLKLSIVLTEARGRTFVTKLYKNREYVAAITSGDVSLDVSDSDEVQILATGKGNGTVVSESGEILEDISLSLTSIRLADVKIADHYSVVDVVDLKGNTLDTKASLFTDGQLVIRVDNLIKAHFDYTGVPVLTLDEIANEVLMSADENRS